MVLNTTDDPLSPVKIGCEVTAEEKRNSLNNSKQVQFDENVVEFADLCCEVYVHVLYLLEIPYILTMN